MPNGDPQEGFFYPTLTFMIDSYKPYPESYSDKDRVCLDNVPEYPSLLLLESSHVYVISEKYQRSKMTSKMDIHSI